MNITSGLKSPLIEANRILVIGCPGSGKSTLAKRLARILDLDYISMDRDLLLATGLEKETARRDRPPDRQGGGGTTLDHGWDRPQLLPSSPAARRRRHLASAAQICMPVRRGLENIPLFWAQPSRTACRLPRTPLAGCACLYLEFRARCRTSDRGSTSGSRACKFHRHHKIAQSS